MCTAANAVRLPLLGVTRTDCGMHDSVRLVAKITGSLILGLIASHFVAGTPEAVEALDAERPLRIQLSQKANIEGQVIHVDALAERSDSSGKVVFAGSSSVMNGIDVAAIAAMWKAKGIISNPVNYGLTSFTAAELPFLKNELLASDVRLVVFAYNTFSFPNRYHPQATSVRWNTSEFLREAPAELMLKPSFSIALPLVGEAVAAVRFQNFIAETTLLRLRGHLRHRDSPYDYPENEPIRPVAQKREQVPTKIDRDDFLQAIYFESDTDGETLGYNGLVRFLQLAKAAHVHVLLMHIPEPDFSYRYGVNVGRIDAHVGRIAAEFGVAVLPRLRSVEANDSLFRDDVHLHSLGRQRFSAWLAQALVNTPGVQELASGNALQ